VADASSSILRRMRLLLGVPDSTIWAINARAEPIDVAVGDDVVRRWDSDRSFYLIVSGRYDVLIDGWLIRTLGTADHFGELAARDWGSGYGYARLATVRCVEAGRLLKLTDQDFQWLADTEPTVRDELARSLADRLQQR
jgi:CRP-like cAMP-binding protein